MISIDGYSLEYFKNRNEIVIGLPQTAATATTTALPIVKRETDFPESKFITVLFEVMRIIYEDAENG